MVFKEYDLDPREYEGGGKVTIIFSNIIAIKHQRNQIRIQLSAISFLVLGNYEQIVKEWTRYISIKEGLE